MCGQAVRIGLLGLGMMLLWLGGAPAQSLFQPPELAVPVVSRAAPQTNFAAGPVPVIARGDGPLLNQSRELAAPGAGPMLQSRALALGDAAGLASRRAEWARRAGHGFGGFFAPYHAPPARQVRAEAARLAANPPRDFSQETDLMCIAVSIYHESRGQPRWGQAAVASVILTRAANPWRWGRTACEVVIPVQFSYLTPRRGFAPIRNRAAWAEAVEIAAEVLLSGPDPRLGGSDHYHATYVDPRWNRSMDHIAQIGDHIFWRDPRSQTAPLANN